jgi:hypothetical protein
VLEACQICSNPLRIAIMTVWVRSLTWSLSTRFLMWKLTVVRLDEGIKQNTFLKGMAFRPYIWTVKMDRLQPLRAA